MGLKLWLLAFGSGHSVCLALSATPHTTTGYVNRLCSMAQHIFSCWCPLLYNALYGAAVSLLSVLLLRCGLTFVVRIYVISCSHQL